MQTMHDTMTSRPDLMARADVMAVAANEPQSADDYYFRLLGVMLAAGVSAGFWMVVLAVALPAISVWPTTMALTLTGMGIASFICASLFAIRTAN